MQQKTQKTKTYNTVWHLLSLVPAVAAWRRLGKVDQRVYLVTPKIRVHTVKIRLMLHPLPDILALAQDVAELVVTAGGQAVGPDDVTSLHCWRVFV